MFDTNYIYALLKQVKSAQSKTGPDKFWDPHTQVSKKLVAFY